MGYLFYNSAAEVGITQAGGKEHGIDGGIEDAVGLRHLHLVLKIGDGAQPANNNLRIVGSCKINRASVKGLNGDIFAVLYALQQHFHPLLYGKKRVLIVIDKNADDQLIDHAGGAADNVHVPQRNGVKTSGINSPCHTVSFRRKTASS